MELYKNIYYIHFDRIDSTNDWVKKNVHMLDPKRLTCVTAVEQTAGRGRFARKWLSPKGQNIYASLYFSVPKNSRYIQNLGQILSLACVDVLDKLGFSTEIKWPNDILLSGKKVAGVLGETISLNEGLGIVLGIGLNVDTPQEVLDEINQPAISLACLSSHVLTFEKILEPLVLKFAENLEILQREDFSPFQAKYESLLAYKGKIINCLDGNRQVKGICHSIDNEGRLKLLISSQEETEKFVEIPQMHVLHSGEITD